MIQTKESVKDTSRSSKIILYNLNKIQIYLLSIIRNSVIYTNKKLNIGLPTIENTNNTMKSPCHSRTNSVFNSTMKSPSHFKTNSAFNVSSPSIKNPYNLSIIKENGKEKNINSHLNSK